MKPAEARALYTWFSVRQCAEEVGLTLEFIREEIRSGRLKASNFGRRKAGNTRATTPRPYYRVKPEDWAEWKADRELKAS